MPLSGLVRAPVVIAADYEDVHAALERMRALLETTGRAQRREHAAPR